MKFQLFSRNPSLYYHILVQTYFISLFLHFDLVLVFHVLTFSYLLVFTRFYFFFIDFCLFIAITLWNHRKSAPFAIFKYYIRSLQASDVVLKRLLIFEDSELCGYFRRFLVFFFDKNKEKNLGRYFWKCRSSRESGTVPRIEWTSGKGRSVWKKRLGTNPQSSPRHTTGTMVVQRGRRGIVGFIDWLVDSYFFFNVSNLKIVQFIHFLIMLKENWIEKSIKNVVL